MGRLEKLKRENIKKANELLNNEHISKYPTPEQKILNPSDNVKNASTEFLNKMNRLKEEKHINEEFEEDTYYVITKEERQDLINMGGRAKEIADALPSYDKFKPN